MSGPSRVLVALRVPADAPRAFEAFTTEIARYNPIRVGKDVELMYKNDLAMELAGVEMLNKHIAAFAQLKDGGSRDLLEHILQGSEEHVDWIETQLEAIKQVGLQNYLAQHLH